MPEDFELNNEDEIDTSIFEKLDENNELGKPTEDETRTLEDGTLFDRETGEILASTDETGDGKENVVLPEAFKDTSSNQPSKKPNSDTILDNLYASINGKKIEEMCEFGREYADMNYNDEFAYLIGRVHEINKPYREHGFAANIGRAPDDLIELASLMVSLAEPLGFLEGCFEEAEEIRKLAMSAYYLEAKKFKVDGWTITDKDASHVSRMLSRPYIVQKGKAEIYSRMLRNIWYGIRHFVDMLNATIMRAGSEVKYVQIAEGAAFRNKKDPTDFDTDGFKEDCKQIEKEIKKNPASNEDDWDDDDDELVFEV